MYTSAALCLGLCIAGLCSGAGVEPIKLVPVGHFDHPALNECSGIVPSFLWEGVFWVHNDSGDEARIFPVDRKGHTVQPEWAGDYQGIRLPTALNIDWEDIGRDNMGNLLIADTGNNANLRRDLVVYVVPEPAPREAVLTRPLRTLALRFPDQLSFPPQQKNFDCEAIFWADGAIHLLTKHRSDSDTRLYRLDPRAELDCTPLSYIGSFPIQGKVTAADISPDGKLLVVLTYDSINTFERSAPGQNWFTGRQRWLPIDAGQCEAICFDRDALRIANEEGDLFLVPRSELREPGASAPE